MKSNVCKIEKGTHDLENILNESERVAQYNRLTSKQTLQLRLLCEEIDGMLPNIIDNFKGDIWIEFEEGLCKVQISIQIPDLNIDTKDELIAIAKNKKNSAAVGIVGKIRNTIEDMLLNESSIGAFTPNYRSICMGMGYCDGLDSSYLWSLQEYRNTVKKEEKPEDWDELEKSVIASIADDVIVGVRGKQANITILKKFS